ncbi:MAG: phosphoribosylformylglycinamidine synthase subunit PurS [Bacteroidia bacterium]|jgi:phosphoribosylformylglycinamidine synthase
MIRFVAEIDVMPHDALLDPQGKAVLTGLAALSLSQVHDVRVGKHLRLRLEAHDQAEAEAMVNKACRELLANPVMESFAFRVLEEQ